jgi:hypothetical protein
MDMLTLHTPEGKGKPTEDGSSGQSTGLSACCTNTVCTQRPTNINPALHRPTGILSWWYWWHCY